MAHFFLHADDLLRGGPWAARPERPRLVLLQLLGFVFVFGLIYGAVMGAFGGVEGRRALQLLYSGLKVPLLLVVTFALSLPSFFVLNSVLGVRQDFPFVLRGLVATQAALTIVLASLAPFTALWYASFAGYDAAILFNAFAFGVASFAAQLLLRRWYRPLIARNPRHRALLRTWLVIYAFVGIQMGWTLRPFVGHPRAQTRFFREEAWSNAYVNVAEIIRNALAGPPPRSPPGPPR
jgi:hypothetical protein